MDLHLLWLVPLLVAGGVACGLLNTLASSGSAVSLPLMILVFGMTDSVANATNRLPVLVGAVMATYTFAKRGQMDWKAARVLVPAAVIGCILGVRTERALSDPQIGILIDIAVAMALVLVLTKLKAILVKRGDTPPTIPWWGVPLVAAVGFWLGLIVLDGATYLLLVLMLCFRYDLPQANALKNLLIAVTAFLPVLRFAHDGKIDWFEGSLLSVGSIVGSYVGVMLSNAPGARTIAVRALIFVISLEIIQLVWRSAAPYVPAFN